MSRISRSVAARVDGVSGCDFVSDVVDQWVQTNGGWGDPGNPKTVDLGTLGRLSECRFGDEVDGDVRPRLAAVHREGEFPPGYTCLPGLHVLVGDLDQFKVVVVAEIRSNHCGEPGN